MEKNKTEMITMLLIPLLFLLVRIREIVNKTILCYNFGGIHTLPKEEVKNASSFFYVGI